MDSSRAELSKELAPEMALRLVRNGYAVAEGIHRKGGKCYDRGARHWNFVNKLMLAHAVNIEQFMLVRYEDIMQSVQKQTMSPRTRQKILDICTDDILRTQDLID